MSGFTRALETPGTTTNDSAAAGMVGELLTATAAGVSLSNGAAKTVVSLLLTAGDWDVWCTFLVQPAGTTSLIIGEVSPTTDTLPGTIGNYFRGPYAFAGDSVFCTPVVPVSLAASTTYYGTMYSLFTVTQTATAKIVARRRR